MSMEHAVIAYCMQQNLYKSYEYLLKSNIMQKAGD